VRIFGPDATLQFTSIAHLNGGREWVQDYIAPVRTVRVPANPGPKQIVPGGPHSQLRPNLPPSKENETAVRPRCAKVRKKPG